ncbi:hypothetical protein [Streptomyces smyrnaeus]|uniref:hypothetical protein n=1 Tax=Streptomyces smyrnaeus TaxID=1387713 RepID=UPI0033E64006
MARIKLASWHAGRRPGDVVEVPDGEVPGLRRDGRVAEVVSDEPKAVAVTPPGGSAAEPALTEQPDEPVKPRRRGKGDG